MPPLPCPRGDVEGEPRDVPARPRQAGDRPGGNGIDAGGHDNRDRGGGASLLVADDGRERTSRHLTPVAPGSSVVSAPLPSQSFSLPTDYEDVCPRVA
jgi:hypothetical protein